MYKVKWVSIYMPRLSRCYHHLTVRVVFVCIFHTQVIALRKQPQTAPADPSGGKTKCLQQELSLSSPIWFLYLFFFQTAIFYVCRVIFTERLTWIGFWLLLHSGRLFNCSLCIHFLTTIWLKLQTQPAEYRALLPVKNMTHIMSVSLRIWFHFDNLFRFTFGRSKITFFEGKNRHTISLSLHGLPLKLNKHITCQN